MKKSFFHEVATYFYHTCNKFDRRWVPEYQHDLEANSHVEERGKQFYRFFEHRTGPQ